MSHRNWSSPARAWPISSGERFVGDKGPLAAEMIESALDGFRRAKRTGDQHIAFMQGLFEPSKLLYARRLRRAVVGTRSPFGAR